MQMTPAIKGQLTKIMNFHSDVQHLSAFRQMRANAVRKVFTKLMPREQAKHAARKFLSKLAIGIIGVSLAYHGQMPTVKAPVYVNLGQSQFVNAPVVPTVTVVRLGR
jgi:hypothetical protein